MTPCPIAFWNEHSPKKIALQSKTELFTYSDLHQLICKICGFLTKISETSLAFPAEISPNAIALLFAAFRMQHCIFPFHPKLPENMKRSFLATSIDPNKISLQDSVNIFELSRNALATAIATSGSTGSPKIALLSIDNHLASARAAITAINLASDDAYLLNLPLYHVSGLAICWRTFLAGATLLMPDSPEEVTHLSMVPTQLYRMLENKIIYPRLKSLLLGGAPPSPTLYQQALQQNLPLYLSYGMTETSSMIAVKKPHHSQQNAGELLPHMEIKITEENEILVKGLSLFQGYFGQDPIDRNSWFPTKDLGRWNSQGHLEILGRKDRQFISGGENIQPEEIERALLLHPYILQARIEPIEDAEFGFRPRAHLFCKNPLNEKEIRAHLEKQLLPYKIPKIFIFHTAPLQTKIL